MPTLQVMNSGGTRCHKALSYARDQPLKAPVNMHLLLKSAITLALLHAGGLVMANDPIDKKACTFKGKKLYGKIQIVQSFPDVKVQEVTSFPDLKVETVTAFPDKCGKWQMVNAFPDTKVQIVTSFPDVKVQYVTSFPGLR